MKKLRLKRKFKIVFALILVITLLLLFTKHKPDLEKNNNDTNITTKKVSKVSQAKLTFVGDLLFEQPFYDATSNGYDPNKYFEMVNEKYFSKDDLTIGNMEVVIGNDSLEVSGVGYSFCAPPSVGKLVAKQSFEVLGTANNHSYDRGMDGLISTIDFFKDNSSIMTVGTYKNEEDRNTLHVNDINGIKFGFLAYTMGTNSKVPEDKRNHIGLFRNPDVKQVTNDTKEIMKNEISNLRSNVDVVIVLMHWGREFTYTVTDEQKSLAAFLNELGVDIILGSHSHNIQSMEWIGDTNKTLVYYSFGNFVSADPIVDRTDQEFLDAYQVGLLSTLSVNKDKEIITIDNIKTIPIINYYDNNQDKFKLIPYNDYTEEYEKSHYLYNKGLNKDFVKTMHEKVIDEEFR